MDYGAPIGYRLALRRPAQVRALVVQNGNAYEEGLREFWDPIKAYWADPRLEHRSALHVLVEAKSTRWQYENGVADRSLLDPTTWLVDQVGLDRPGNREIQMDLFYDYRTNVPLYPEFQAFFRAHQPPTLIVWGRNDVIFPPGRRSVPAGLAERRDAPAGHRALRARDPRRGDRRAYRDVPAPARAQPLTYDTPPPDESRRRVSCTKSAP